MPNYCEGSLIVTGPGSEIARFREFACEKTPRNPANPQALDANAFVPYPQRFRDQDEVARKWYADHKGEADAWRKAPKDGFNSGGYEWCLLNWGTKWGFLDVCIADVKSPRRLHYTFTTAWSPPTPVIAKAGELFPTLKFTLRYWEGGAGFKGVFVVKGGEVVDDMTGGYSGRRGG